MTRPLRTSVRLLLPLLLLPFALAALACNLGTQPLIPTMPPIATFAPTPTPFFTVASPTPFGTPALNPVIPTLPGAFPTLPISGGACNLMMSWPRYAVQNGDTLYGLASLTGSTVETLISANCLTNPNYLEVGQLLYVPRLPVYPTATYANPVQVKFRLVPQPAQLISGQYRVTGQFQLIASNVTVGTKVVFYYSYPGSGQNYLGEALIFGGSAQVAVNASAFASIPTFYMTAVSKNAAGQNVQYTDTIALVQASPAATVTPSLPTAIAPTALNAPDIGSMTVSPSQPVFDPGLRYAVQGGTLVTLSVSGLRNALTVRFLLFPAENTEPIVVGQVSNPGNLSQAQALWMVDCNRADGRLVAQAIGPTGATSLSNSLNVFCPASP